MLSKREDRWGVLRALRQHRRRAGPSELGGF